MIGGRPVIGITGLPGSGKSTLAQFFKQRRFYVQDADIVGHQLLERPELQKALTDHFGPSIVNNHHIDRKRLAEIVFSNSQQLELLNQILHPKIQDELQHNIQKHCSMGYSAVLEVALLVESQWSELCDFIINIETPRPIRLNRVFSRDWDGQELEGRERHHDPDLKRKIAHFHWSGEMKTEEIVQKVLEFELELRYNEYRISQKDSFIKTVLRRLKQRFI